MSNQWRQLVIRRTPGLYQSPHIRAMVRQDSGALRRLQQELKRPSGVLSIPTQHLPVVRYSAKPRTGWQRLPYLHPEMKPILISFVGTLLILILMCVVIVLLSHVL
jgi:hypothetical protein